MKNVLTHFRADGHTQMRPRVNSHSASSRMVPTLPFTVSTFHHLGDLDTLASSGPSAPHKMRQEDIRRRIQRQQSEGQHTTAKPSTMILDLGSFTVTYELSVLLTFVDVFLTTCKSAARNFTTQQQQ